MRNHHERRIGHREYEDYECGARHWDIVSGDAFRVGDTIMYREFNFTTHTYTGRQRSFVVRLVTPKDKEYVLSLESIVGAIAVADVVDLYERVRIQALQPSPRAYVDYLLREEGGVEVMVHIVAMMDGLVSRLYPTGSTVRWYACVKGPLGGIRVQERELDAFNGILATSGCYEPQGDQAIWKERGPSSR